MWLTQLNITVSLSRFRALFFLLILISLSASGSNGKNLSSKNAKSQIDSLFYSAEDNFQNERFLMAISEYKIVLEKGTIDSSVVYKKIAFAYTKLNQPELACKYIEIYIKRSLDVEFVGHSYFNEISSSKSYQALSSKYLKKINFWALFCLYVGFIGVFIYTVLNLRKGPDKIANFLISTFLLIHSFFIIRISILITNYEYYLPHTLYLSASFSFLYGPLIYFYFKRVATKYEFKLIDILHLVPTVIFLILLFPIYSLPQEEKLRMIINNERPYLQVLVTFKLISLIIYIGLIITIYITSIKKNKNLVIGERNRLRNIVILCAIYIIAYTIYAVLINQFIIRGFLFYLQIISMSLLALYISYTSYARLILFENSKGIKGKTKIQFHKYRKSNLTESLSAELKEKLLILLDQEKVYLQNDITLQKLADYLDTTRNNASQIINEHFDLNFFELINTYRIKEAKEILKNEKSKNLNLIEVAYEVGFNNKVTFNKSFKKYNHTTPSEYVKSLIT
ncbi:helix-turn-helix domain-containing protein [uncultured Aquimarina sp.]|uniref:helix-turn-helix domain-containing protein n=1 Tax=uncultured Aquimarina sp. TaxID=575652 RepID=UPI00260ECF23|nr:helix-turn-helix domain-containing protein [uncultured Aquimarina sp.]